VSFPQRSQTSSQSPLRLKTGRISSSGSLTPAGSFIRDQASSSGNDFGCTLRQVTCAWRVLTHG